MEQKIIIMGDRGTYSQEISYLDDVISHCEESTQVIDTGENGNEAAITELRKLEEQGEVAGVIMLGSSDTIMTGSDTLRGLSGTYPKLMALKGNHIPEVEIANTMVYLTGANHPFDKPILENTAFAMAGMVKGNYPDGIERPEIMEQQPYETTPLM